MVCKKKVLSMAAALSFVGFISGCTFFRFSEAVTPGHDRGIHGKFLPLTDAEGAVEQTAIYGPILHTTGGGIALKETLRVPYTLRFEAQMPYVEQEAPDFGIPQVWFSIDYVGEFDRLAFALRGGSLQSVTVYDYQQRTPPLQTSDQHITTINMAYQNLFWRFPMPIVSGEWFTVELHVQQGYAALYINNEFVSVYNRTMQPKAKVAFGDSWQSNAFRAIVSQPAERVEHAVFAGETLFQTRSAFHPNAFKYDFGPADIAPAAGWQRISESVVKDTTVAGWRQKTAGSRHRPSNRNVTSQKETLIALVRQYNQAILALPLDAGRYVVSVGVGDAGYHTAAHIMAPDGNAYKAALPADQWGEIRFKLEHPGGLLSLPMSSVEGQGMSICYLVVEPWQESGVTGLSRPVQDLDKENHSRRQEQRSGYASAKLPSLNGRSAFEQTLSGDWLFWPDILELNNAVSPDIDDINWHVLEVPAFWNEVGWWIFGQGHRQVSQRFILEEIARTEGYTFNPRGVRTAFYRHWLEIPEDWGGKRVHIEFDAVASVCAVYLNGELVGTNRGMFKPFRVDVTDHMLAGQKNLLALWVNNGVPERLPAASSENVDDVIAVTIVVEPDLFRDLPRAIYRSPRGEGGEPLADRQGGIWQDVRIVVSQDVALEDIWPRTGLDVLELDITASGLYSDKITVEVSVADEDENVLVQSCLPWRANGQDDNKTMTLQLNDLSPKRWSPARPHLYTLTVTLKDKGQILDQKSQAIGFRTFEVDGNRFLLNGKPFRWLGANMGPFGLRPNDRELARTFTKLMKEGNQNATRSVCSPYPRVWLEEADRQGVAVSLEGTWSWLMISHIEIPKPDILQAWKEEWFALMRQLRGHPSIVMWTINNETYITHDDNKERRAEKWNILQDVIAEMRQIDPTRPIVLWSGYSHVREQEKVSEIEAVIIGTDDGEIDDVHMYAGTYQPSWVGNPGLWEAFLEKMMLPDRPMISQEAATAYPNTDTGHQESSYIQTWHGQTWAGDAIYDYRNPMTFLHRHAKITKEQIEIVRRMDVAGWLAFCNGTWYNQVHVPDEITPYPVHEAAALALSPVLVAMDMRERNFFAGQTITPRVFLRNDDLLQRDFDRVTVVLKLKNDADSVVFEGSADSVDIPLASLHEQSFELTLPRELSEDRGLFRVELEAINSDGEILGANKYDLTLCSKNYISSYEKPTIYVTGLVADSPLFGLFRDAGVTVVHKLPSKTSAGIWFVWEPDGEDCEAMETFAESGGRVFVQNPENIAEFPSLKTAEIGDFSTHGEVANVVDARNSPLLRDMEETDIAWWHHLSGGPKVYDQAIILSKGIPDTVHILMNHIPPHGYDYQWQAEYPLIQINVGSGAMVISTLNFDLADRDPLAARLLINILDYLDKL